MTPKEWCEHNRQWKRELNIQHLNHLISEIYRHPDWDQGLIDFYNECLKRYDAKIFIKR